MILLEGASGEAGQVQAPWQGMTIAEHLNWNMEKGLSKKEAIAVTARERNIPKKQVYAESIVKK